MSNQITRIKVNVEKYRAQIEACQNRLSIHWHSCVTDGERINWFVASFKSFQSLAEMYCSTATQSDINMKENVRDEFAAHCSKHEPLWLCARAAVKGEDEQSKLYAVSDETGDYIFYTDDYHLAKGCVDNLDRKLREKGIEGCGAVMKNDGTGRYELFY